MSGIKQLNDFPISATFAQHIWTNQYKGTDYATPSGLYMPPLKNGIVTRVYTGGLGENILQVKDELGRYEEYVHITKSLVRVGNRVNVNEPAFITGATGEGITGPHTHVNLWDGKQWNHTVDPGDYFLTNEDMSDEEIKKMFQELDDIKKSVGGDTRKVLGDVFNMCVDMKAQLKEIQDIIEAGGSGQAEEDIKKIQKIVCKD